VLCGSGDALLRAGVRRRSFLGGVIRYELQLSGGGELKVDVPNAAHALRPETGDSVGVRWRDADLSLLPLDT